MIRIIGLGSAFNDDNIGWRCLQTQETRLLELIPQLEIIYCASPGTELIHLLQPGLTTLLVDALLTDKKTGQIHVLQQNQLHNNQAISSHEISVANILQLAANLNRLPDKLYILGIGVNPQQQLGREQINTLQTDLVMHISRLVNDSKAA